MGPKELLDYWESRGWLARLSEGAHLVITGGEPLLWQKPLASSMEALSMLMRPPHIEVETNATIAPISNFDRHVQQYNCSPKLTSAGNPWSRSYRPEVLALFAADARAVFKFVVQETSDIDELRTEFLEPFEIDPMRVWLMPEAATRDRLIEQSEWIVEHCKELGFHFTTRLHLLLWDKATGV